MASSSDGTGRAFWTGWRRVLGAPALVIGVWLATMATALPAARAVRMAIGDDLGSSLTAERVAAGPDMGWWDEFEARARGAASTLVPGIVGGAAPLSNISAFLDHPGDIPLSVVSSVVAALVVWLFLTGGILDRLARGRPVGTRAFFGACGVFFFRFLRLGLLVGIGYFVLAGPLHGFLFDRFYPWITHETSAERVGFLWRLALYAIWLIPVVLLNLTADYAKVRAVVEDRRSMVGALAAGARFVGRHLGSAGLLYLANALVLGVALIVYLLVAPGARGGDWRLLAVLAIGQAWILARIATKLAFLSISAAYFQQKLAHASFTAEPAPVWPESPAAEAIDNAARFGIRPEA